MAFLRKTRKLVKRCKAMQEEFKGTAAQDFLSEIIRLGEIILDENAPKSSSGSGAKKPASPRSKPDA